MVGVVLVSHGTMAQGTVEAARMISGLQEALATVTLHEGDDLQGLVQRVASAIGEVDRGDGVVVMVDLFGGTPFNAAARVAMGSDKIEVISGLSLPMLVELLDQREGKTLQEVVEVARAAGNSGIRTLSESLATQAKDRR